MHRDTYLGAMILTGAVVVAVPALIIAGRESEAAGFAIVIGGLAMLCISEMKPPRN